MKIPLSRLFILVLCVTLIVPTSLVQAQEPQLPTPVLVSPSDQAQITQQEFPGGNPMLRWTPVSSATRYTIQLSSDETFSDPISYQSVAPAFITMDLADGIWYWRVKAENETAESAFSQPWQFTKTWTGGQRPVHILPPPMAMVTTTPVLQWTAVAGATHYVVNLQNTLGLSVDYTTPNTSLTLPIVLTAGKHYWTVTPYFHSRPGVSSDITDFTFFDYRFDNIALTQPENEASVQHMPVFQWTPWAGAMHYQIQFSADATFEVLTAEYTTEFNFFQPTFTMENGQKLFWRVRAQTKNYGPTNWSSPSSFTRQWTEAPALLAPTDASDQLVTPFFVWTPVLGATQYHLQISTSADFNTIFWQETTSSTYALPTPSDWTLGLQYYWRVTPIDGQGVIGTASSPFTFVYASDLNSIAVQPIFPLPYATPNSTAAPAEDRTVSYPVFMWTRTLYAAGLPQWAMNGLEAISYKVEVADAPFDPQSPPAIRWSTITQNMSAAPDLISPMEYQDGSVYYWRVYPLDKDANPTISLDNLRGWPFRVDSSMALPGTSAAIPSLIAPQNGGETIDAWPMFQWEPMDGAFFYEIQVSPDAAFPVSQSFIQGLTKAPFYTPTTRPDQTSGGVYYWRVRAYSQGVQSEWSETRVLVYSHYPTWTATSVLASEGDTWGDGYLVAREDADEVAAAFNLERLGAGTTQADWRFGTVLNSEPLNDTVLALYIDTDQTDNSGASEDPIYHLEFTAYRPEIIVHTRPNSAAVYTWNTEFQTWNPLSSIETLGGSLFTVGELGVSTQMEISLPRSLFPSGTAGVVMATFAKDQAGSDPLDLLPNTLDASGAVNQMVSLSERLSLVEYPDYALAVGNYWDASIKPFWWLVNPRNPWDGFAYSVHPADHQTWEPIDSTHSGPFAPHGVVISAEGMAQDALYTWKVRALHQDGESYIPSPWSVEQSRSKVGLNVVELHNDGNPQEPRLYWKAPEGASAYLIQVSRQPDFSADTQTYNTIQPLLTLTKREQAGTYYARVAIQYAGDTQSAWSTPISFDVWYPAPTGLGIVSTESDYLPLTCWTATDQNGYSPESFRVQFSTTAAFTTLLEEMQVRGNCWQSAKFYPDGQYFVRVASEDVNGIASAFTQPISFQKSTLAPQSLMSEKIPSTSSMMFIWAAVTGAAQYKLQVASDAQFSQIIEQVTVQGQAFLPQKTYPSTFYWRVAAQDEAGNAGPFSAALIERQNAIFMPIITR